MSAGLKKILAEIDSSLTMLVVESDVREQPDARAFGAAVEAAVLRRWPDLCATWGVTPLRDAGRRTIYDAGFVDGGRQVGVDFRTKDLAEGRYSDGGICAVANLLRWMVRNDAILVVTEFGYMIERGAARFAYVASAPIHSLPLDVYRIANLGTGQVRIGRSIHASLEEIDWDRSPAEFFAAFAPVCIEHYERVRTDAAVRIAAIEAFVESEFTAISLT